VVETIVKLQFLGQTFGLVSGHVYRGRFLVPGSAGDFPCPISDARLDQVKSALDALGSVVNPNYATSNWEPWAVMKLPNIQVFNTLGPNPWPADRREVPPNMNPGGRLCPVWGQSTTISDFNLPLDAVKNVLAPLGGVLLNFWDETSGQRLYDAPVTSLAPPITPGQVSPGVPPLIPPGGGPVSPPLPPPPTPIPQPTEKKENTMAWVLGGLVLIGAVALISSR